MFCNVHPLQFKAYIWYGIHRSLLALYKRSENLVSSTLRINFPYNFFSITVDFRLEHTVINGPSQGLQVGTQDQYPNFSLFPCIKIFQMSPSLHVKISGLSYWCMFNYLNCLTVLYVIYVLASSIIMFKNRRIWLKLVTCNLQRYCMVTSVGAKWFWGTLLRFTCWELCFDRNR